MGGSAADCGALGEVVSFLSFLRDLPDRRRHGKVAYPLAEVLLLSLLAVLAGSETITDIARFGEAKLALLRRFRPFADGTPRTTITATSSPRSTPRPSSAASSPGWRASPAPRSRSSATT